MLGQLTIQEVFQKMSSKSVLIKKDRMDGFIYICPTCKTYICGGNTCISCKQEIDWNKPIKYTGKYHY